MGSVTLIGEGSGSMYSSSLSYSGGDLVGEDGSVVYTSSSK